MGCKLQCNKCKDIIESKIVHDFVRCKCGAIFVDGGDEYCRYGGFMEDIKFLDDKGDDNSENKHKNRS